ncbi:MAG: hydrogenase maturation peptidase HycI [Coriobacteriales bacterium]|jgi:hydrogenase 3 maturation protease|nr:hydrogenase maturation peptidase HycI [Coriobacteriales bacterium]
MSGRVVFTVGNVLRGDDAVGPLLAKMLEHDPAPGWTVVDGGQMPEDELAVVRRMRPDFLLLVDAADMGDAAGTIRELDEEDVATGFLMTTHSLPMTFLLGNLKESCEEMTFLGIQPGDTSFFAPLTPPVRQAVESLYAWLQKGGDPACPPYGT